MKSWLCSYFPAGRTLSLPPGTRLVTGAEGKHIQGSQLRRERFQGQSSLEVWAQTLPRHRGLTACGGRTGTLRFLSPIRN